ncbi:MAG TPA: hypothetical protein VFF16_08910 [Telluria sp.]|nr:hypothetical protein [Telluria sp.]
MNRTLAAALASFFVLAGCGGDPASSTGRVTQSGSAGAVRYEVPLQADSARLSAGTYFTAGADQDGHVYAWGDNTYGQLGDDATLARPAPVPVAGLSGVRAVAAGGYHVTALERDGTVWTWGNNTYGQLGQGYFSSRVGHPVPVQGLSGIAAISSGYLFSLATHANGTVYSWGRVANANRAGFQPVSGLSNVAAATAGYEHALAVTRSGALWGWGSNKAGQLGTGRPAAIENTPVRIASLDKVVGAAAGYMHSLALRQDGTVWAWGSNAFGQLGVNLSSSRLPVRVHGLPVPVNGASGVKAIAAGTYNSVVVYSDGSVWAWGGNGYGQIGNGTTVRATEPQQIQGLGRAVSATVGNGHIAILMADGSVYAIGFNANGQLGNNTTANAMVPVQVSGPQGAGNLDLGQSRDQ